MKKRTLIVAGIFLVSLGAGAAVMYSLPYLTIYRIIAAFENQDQRRLASLVDFTQIQENLKRYIGAKIRGDAAPHGEASGIPDSLVNRIVERAVNELITPEGLAAFMKERLEALAVAGKGNGSPPPSPWSLFTAFLSHAELAYTSPAEFVISFPAGDSGTLRFVLRRSGFSWRLTNVEF